MKYFLSAMIVIATLFGQQTKAEGVKTSPIIVTTFEKAFPGAANALWSEYKGVHRVHFTFEHKSLIAFYSKQGTLLAFGRYLTQEQLPLSLQLKLTEVRKTKTVKDIFELIIDGTAHYYTTVETKTKVQVLRSYYNEAWELHLVKKK